MSKAGRLGLIALAAAVVVAAFVIARPGKDDKGSGNQAADATAPTATAPSAPAPPPDGPDKPQPVKIDLQDHAAVGGAKSITVVKGDQVRIVVSSDAPDEIHLHGYDIEHEVTPGKPARFSFPATIDGIFELESHHAEDNGEDPLIARLTVEPS